MLQRTKRAFPLLALVATALACAHPAACQSASAQNQGNTGGQSAAQPTTPATSSNEPVLLRKPHPAPAAQDQPAALDETAPDAKTSGGDAQPPTLRPVDAAASAQSNGSAVRSAPGTTAPASVDDSGPNDDASDIVVPRLKRKSDDEPAPPAPAFKNPPGLGNLTLQINVPEVTVDVGVLLQKTHQFVPNLQSNNFVVYEDGQPQKILRFKRIEAPVTVLILAEFASTNYQFVYDMRNAVWAFAQQLRPQDYVALMTYDLRTQLVTDFTQDKNQLLQGIQDLTIPGFSERNLFDALYQALDRLTRIEGQKYILLIGSGRDTFSRITLDKTLQKIRETPNVTIFSVSTGGFLRAVTEGNPRFAMSNVSYLQADNQMQTFARMTGGMFFAPRFEGELPDDMSVINEAIRAKYELVYHPTNSNQDGTYRKIQVALVDDEGRPLQFQDEKHHSLKYDLIYRNGYRAQQQVQ